MENVLSNYFERPEDVNVFPINQGYINSTYKLSLGYNNYILQKINTSIFLQPEIIVSNMLTVANHLKSKNYTKAILDVIPNKNGNYLTFLNGETWRMTSFVPNSVCYDKVLSKEQAFAAASAISEFHNVLNDLSINRISESIPGFLDYKKRVSDYKLALINGNKNRIERAQNEINFIQDHIFLIDKYLEIEFPKRVVHADAKISNFLFDSENETKVAGLIDWDTILPGNILCDFGDMIRTYSNLKSEDDPDPINNFSLENYQAVKDGFISNLKDILTEEELKSIDLTAFVVILIQAIRFLTDFISDDVYYHTSKENQNLDRTLNQINLLKSINQHICIN
ncbi:phosphotransferase enzyme family protein [Faecalibacter bovis]|uniref:Phosphotransferase n=1 Tax=Faecalibacter bovis TaxID=2898187 RepID=A0ABX7XCG7_9FLAO|nr:phosphotransferase [Faecalibacter bovis]MBS7332252.1 phosphotransferase [Weeksellaceae bacterium]QTV05609.1 phosphotransferase [Faecalibacter bovis]